MQPVNFEISLDAYSGMPCPYCGKQMGRRRGPSRDHILPRSLGGSGRALNLLVVCAPCNARKANMHPDAWVAWLREFRPHRADQVAAIYAARLDAARAWASVNTMRRDPVVLTAGVNGGVNNMPSGVNEPVMQDGAYPVKERGDSGPGSMP